MTSPSSARLTPRQHYQQDLQRPGFQADPAQAHAVDCLQALHDELVDRWHAERGSVLTRLSRGMGGREPVRGLYFWGGVGRGKTYLMDIFFESLPFRRKMRSHFHRFMCEVHAQLRAHAGERDPLAARAMAGTGAG